MPTTTTTTTTTTTATTVIIIIVVVSTIPRKGRTVECVTGRGTGGRRLVTVRRPNGHSTADRHTLTVTRPFLCASVEQRKRCPVHLSELQLSLHECPHYGEDYVMPLTSHATALACIPSLHIYTHHAWMSQAPTRAPS